MAKGKYDFILELLEYKRLNSHQKERILKLAAQEIKTENNKDEELLQRIEEIEHLLKRTTDSANSNLKNNVTPAHLPKYIDPKYLYSFLRDYNTDPILKTTCHEIDRNELENILSFCQIDEYEFENHRQKVQERFTELVNDSKYFLDYKIKNLIYAYITGKTYLGKIAGWTADNIQVGWNNSNLLNWCSENKNKIPHPDSGLCQNQGGVEYVIRPSVTTNVLGKKKLTSFSDVVLHFKHLFHLRSDNSLLDILTKVNSESKEWRDRICFEIDTAQFKRNFEFFTNVEKLIQAYKILINLIIDVVAKNGLEKPIVELSLLERPDGMELSICHRNSIFRKSIINTLEREGLTFTNLIKDQLNGLCDLYLKADFGDGQYAEINIWDGNPKSSIALPFFKGVEYTMKFKRR